MKKKRKDRAIIYMTNYIFNLKTKQVIKTGEKNKENYKRNKKRGVL